MRKPPPLYQTIIDPALLQEFAPHSNFRYPHLHAKDVRRGDSLSACQCAPAPDGSSRLQHPILVLVGLPAAGKSTVSKALQEQHGYSWVRTRDVVRLFTDSDGIHNLQATGTNLSIGSGAEAFCVELFRRVSDSQPTVIDAVRPIEHWRRMRENYGPRALLISVVAPRSLRQNRFKDSRHGSIEDRDRHQVEQDIPSLIEDSLYTVVNQDDLIFRVNQLADFANYIVGRNATG